MTNTTQTIEEERYKLGRTNRYSYAGLWGETKVIQSIPFETALFRGYHYAEKDFDGNKNKTSFNICLAYWPNGSKPFSNDAMDIIIIEDSRLNLEEAQRIYLEIIDDKNVRLGVGPMTEPNPKVQTDFPLKTLEEKIEKGREPMEHTIENTLRRTAYYQK